MINKSMDEYLNMSDDEFSDVLSEMTKGDCFEFIKRLRAAMLAEIIVSNGLKELVEKLESGMNDFGESIAESISKYGF